MSRIARTPQFSRDELEAWWSILDQFPNWILNRAVIEVAVGGDNRFPGVNDLYRVGRREALKFRVWKPEYNPHRASTECQPPRLSSGEIDSIGRRLGLPVHPNSQGNL